MHPKFVILPTAALALAAITTSASAAFFQVYAPFPGAGTGFVSYGYAVSGDGSTAVGTARTSNAALNPGIAFIAHVGDTTISAVPGLPSGISIAYGVSYDGSVILGQDATATTGTLSPFYATASGIVQIGPANNSGAAYGISRNNTITGIVTSTTPLDSNAVQHAFVYTLGSGLDVTTPTLLPETQPLPGKGDATSNSVAISESGTVVAGWAHNSQGKQQAAIWTQDSGGTWVEDTLIPQLTNDQFKHDSATGVSGDGSLVVGWANVNNSSTTQSFIYDVLSTNLTTLSSINGIGTGTEALTISADGTLIGGSDSSGAVFWDTADNSEHSLADYLTANGIAITPGWTLKGLDSISDDDKTFTGWATDASGNREAFVASLTSTAVPEPASVATLLVGATILIRRRKSCQD
ncbi:MAG TPA: PEP-CTERM sorting domain-containing protein [Phycisphaerae bacterium]|nr:PEP-CTERM sorting domain-containing protein [Phycisphaerae bacterium]